MLLKSSTVRTFHLITARFSEKNVSCFLKLIIRRNRGGAIKDDYLWVWREEEKSKKKMKAIVVN